MDLAKRFFQMMLRANGELFWFRWQKGKKEPPKGFRFKPYNLNKSMWFLFTNQLEESLQNMTDEDRQERAMRGFLCCRWAVGNNIVDLVTIVYLYIGRLHRLGLAPMTSLP